MMERDDGFTLIELLVSLFIFAILSAATMSAFFQTVETRERITEQEAEITELQQMRAIIRADMNAITLRQARDPLGGFEPYVISTDGQALLNFTRRGRENPGGLSPRGDVQRVVYYFKDGALIRSVLPHENPAQLSKPIEKVLLEGLRDVELEALVFNNGRFQSIRGWRVAAADTRLGASAIALKLTSNQDVTTTHLFELGL